MVMRELHSVSLQPFLCDHSSYSLYRTETLMCFVKKVAFLASLDESD